MSVYGDAIIGGIAWEAFAQTYGFYSEKINNFALRVYISQQLKAMENAKVFSPKQLEEMTDVIEATVIETPEEIKQMDEPKDAFEAYFKKTIKESLIDIEDSEIEIDLGDGTLEGSVKHIKNSIIKIK